LPAGARGRRPRWRQGPPAWPGERFAPRSTVMSGMAEDRRTVWRTHARLRGGHLEPSSIPRSAPQSDPSRGNADDRLLAPLRQHPLWTALGLLIAAMAAATRFAAIGILPPSFELKPFAHATATAQVVVANTPTFRQAPPGAYSTRAYALADMVASPEVAKYVARAAGLPASKIGILGPLWTDLWRSQQWANGPKRASQIIIENRPYHITINEESSSPPWTPVIDVVTQAPSTAIAARLATAVAAGLSAYLRDLQAATGVPKPGRYEVSQIVPVSVAPARKSQLVNVGAFTFFAVFLLWCGLVVAVSSLMRDLRASAARSKVRGGFDRSSTEGPLLARTRLMPRPTRMREP
jgi:hypothetical protein